MEKEQILRDDFPTSRRGWDPNAVRSHLRAVAKSASPGEGAPALADVAAERVRGVIEAAEEAAAKIENEAQAEADRILDAARSDSERMRAEAQVEVETVLSEAREESAARIEQANAAVGGLISQADELRSRVGLLGEELAGSAPSREGTVGEVPGGPVIVPEPTPPTIPEPTPDPVPEPTPDPVPEPTPEPNPDPVPPEPGPDPEPPTPEPEPPPPAAEENGTSTDELIAQLRGGSGGNGGGGEDSDDSDSEPSDVGAARLVAMNMALEGSSREEIAAQVGNEFGSVEDVDGLVDDVFARAGR